jgi:DNA-binding NtrC family response regulator
MRSRTYASTVWRRVLLVEDDLRVRDSLTRAVREMGFEVRVTALADNALRLLERETHDILLIDVGPQQGGVPFLARVREQWPDVQTIVMARLDDVELTRRSLNGSAADVDILAKPCGLGELEVALDRARRRRMQRVPQALEPALPEPPEDVNPHDLTAADTRGSMSLEELERKHILATLEKNRGNRTLTAADLGISLRKLYYRLGQYQREGLLRR